VTGCEIGACPADVLDCWFGLVPVDAACVLVGCVAVDEEVGVLAAGWFFPHAASRTLITRTENNPALTPPLRFIVTLTSPSSS
jgi:hypothetical protein